LLYLIDSRSIQNKSAFRHSLVPVLRCCLSLTSANALLGRGKLFLLSHTNIKCFFEGIDTRGCILDVGAGDGCVSQYLKTLFSEVVAVESSLFMVLRLRAAGFKSVHSSSLSAFDSASFDAVSLLNIVDRVDDPFALLEDAARIVKDKGLVLIALVFPYDPLVELGPRFAKPSRRLPLSAESPEQFVAEFSCKVCSGLGLSLIRCGRWDGLFCSICALRLTYLSTGYHTCRKEGVEARSSSWIAVLCFLGRV